MYAHVCFRPPRYPTCSFCFLVCPQGGEALQVVDPTEAWVFHILADDTGTGAVWAAQKVPAGHITAVANQFIIRTVCVLNRRARTRNSQRCAEFCARAHVQASPFFMHTTRRATDILR